MDNIILKNCSKCGKFKPITEFVKDNRRKDGYTCICKECRRKKDNERYKILKKDDSFMKRKREHNKKYKNKHKSQIDKYNAEYRMRPEVVERMREYHQTTKSSESLTSIFKNIARRCKNRAIEKDVPYAITWKDIEELYTTTCPILEIPLNWKSGTGRNDNTPSVDRIIPELGYVKGNIKIVSNLANMMKNSATLEQLKTFTKNILKYMNCEEIVQSIENNESIELQDKELVR